MVGVWLQCLVLPGGPVFVGKITTGDAYDGASFLPLTCSYCHLLAWDGKHLCKSLVLQ